MPRRYQKCPDLPPRSDPNYDRLYRAMHKERIARKTKEQLQQKIEANPNFWKERYNPEKAAEYRKTNKVKFAEKQWRTRGIIDLTYDRYLAELAAQQGKCKICCKPLTKPQADHCHKTGKFRGILCIPCNNGLGKYELYKDLYEQYLK